MHAHDAGIDLGIPVQVPGCVRVCLQLLLDLRPGAVLFPPGEPVVAGFAWPVTIRDLLPLRAVRDSPQDPVDHLPVITPPATTLRPHARKQRFQPCPFLISQIPSHDLPTIDLHDPS